jgi:hypothetical protein
VLRAQFREFGPAPGVPRTRQGAEIVFKTGALNIRLSRPTDGVVEAALPRNGAAGYPAEYSLAALRAKTRPSFNGAATEPPKPTLPQNMSFR